VRTVSVIMVGRLKIPRFVLTPLLDHELCALSAVPAAVRARNRRS
jgi:hypothetical protein